MKLIQKIKRKLNRCDSCWKKAAYHFEYPALSEEDAKNPIFDYCCHDHAITSGFCIGCGYFCAGTESFDMSKVKGMCSDCVDEWEYEMGVGEEYGDMDYYDDYGHDFSEKQPQETMSQSVSSREEEK